MAFQLDSVFDDVLGSRLVDQVTDFFKQIDLGQIELGDFFDGISLDGLVDGLRDGLDSFFGDFNLVNLFRGIDKTLGGVDLLEIDFDGLLKGFVGDLSVNQALKDLGSLVGDINLTQLFVEDSTGSSFSPFTKQVLDITGALFDDLLTDASHILAGDRGANRLTGFATSDFLSGYGGNDSLLGLGGDDLLLGDRGQDLLYGGRGRDILFSGIGKDWLSGGQGNDTFVLQPGTGYATVSDFQVGRDAIALLGNLALGNLSLTQQGANVLLRNGDDLLAILQTVSKTALNVADFVWS